MRDVEPVLRDVAMDGAIIYSCSPVDEHVEWLRRRHLPLVLSTSPPTTAFRASPSPTERAPALRPRISSSSGTGGSRCSWLPPMLRTTGTSRARAPARLARRARPGRHHAGAVHVERSDGEEAYAAARELLAAPDRPTAVLAFSDALAADVLRAAADLRLRVPADVSVVGS